MVTNHQGVLLLDCIDTGALVCILLNAQLAEILYGSGAQSLLQQIQKQLGADCFLHFVRALFHTVGILALDWNARVEEGRLYG
jgi:hypothetical protein